MGRWLAFLNNYDFEIQHRPGKSHGNADALSRRSCTVCDFCERREQQELAVLAWDGDDQHFCGLLVADNPDVSQQWFESYSPTQLRQWQDDDPVLHKVLQWVESGSKPSWQDIQSEGSSLRQYWSSFAHLELKDGVLYRRCDDALSSVQTLRLVAPPAIRDKIFHFLHSCRTGGHLGINRTVSSVRRRFWWSGWRLMSCAGVNTVTGVRERNHRPGPGRAPLHQEPVGSPMERIAFDILSFPQETDLGNKCVLVVCDYFTKWTEAFPLKDHQATTVADTLMTQIFLRFGVPRIIHSDQAPEFTSELMQELFRLLEIQQTRTCPYRPQSDGLVERFNRTLIDMLSKFCGDYTQDWDEHIPYLLCAYRASVNESTGCSPNLLMLGREILLPIDLMFPCSSLPSYKCRTEYVEWLKRQWRTISRGFVSTLSLLLRDRNGILMTGQNYICSGRVLGSFGFTHQISETNWKVCTLGHTWWLVSLERWLILFSGTPPIDQSQSMLTTSRDIIVRISLNRGWARQPGINQVGHQVLQDKGSQQCCHRYTPGSICSIA